MTDQELQQRFESQFGQPISFFTSYKGRIVFIDTESFYCDGSRYMKEDIMGIDNGVYREKSWGVLSSLIHSLGTPVMAVIIFFCHIIAALSGLGLLFCLFGWAMGAREIASSFVYTLFGLFLFGTIMPVFSNHLREHAA